MKKLFLIVLCLVLLSGCQLAKKETTPANVSNQITENNSQPINQNNDMVDSQAISLEEVAQHNTKEDCWMAIDGKVYNVTEFVASHPGGKAIIEGCGQDATELFRTRPMGSGTDHSDRARNLLDKYLINELK